MASIIFIIGIIIGCIAMFFNPRIFSIVAILLCFFIGIIKVISVGFPSFMGNSKVDNADLANYVISAIFFCTAIICYHLRYTKIIHDQITSKTNANDTANKAQQKKTEASEAQK